MTKKSVVKGRTKSSMNSNQMTPEKAESQIRFLKKLFLVVVFLVLIYTILSTKGDPITIFLLSIVVISSILGYIGIWLREHTEITADSILKKIPTMKKENAEKLLNLFRNYKLGRISYFLVKLLVILFVVGWIIVLWKDYKWISMALAICSLGLGLYILSLLQCIKKQSPKQY